MTRVFVGVGSNVRKYDNIRAGLAALESGFGPVECSPAYESAAVGFDGDPFLNLVVSFETDLAPDVLQSRLRRIEDDLGRDRSQGSWAPRTIDLDLLLYGALVQHGGGLDLPDPHITRYAFVLRPLSELAPSMRHPETGESFSDLWKGFPQSAQPLAAVMP